MKEIEGTNITLTSMTSVDCGGSQLHLPLEWVKFRSHGRRGVLSLSPKHESDSDPDFEIPDWNRNVIGIGPDCEVDWFVEEPGDAMAPEDYHASLWTVSDRVLTQTVKANRMFELDGETGAILDHWPEDVFVVDGVHHDFVGEINNIMQLQKKTLVDADQSVLYCFGTDGQQLWSLELVRGKAWQFRLDSEDNLVHLGYLDRPKNSSFVVDGDTGEILEQEYGSEYLGEDLREAN
ncbi:hypothetical protein BRC64_06660 [Halobacteriales archaeon QH_10_67_22]|nr:MAG: hypothetical protein BRC64_06660 [Halobacteriales archaeon QH_10_67_22]